jgi:hypothetical protein
MYRSIVRQNLHAYGAAPSALGWRGRDNRRAISLRLAGGCIARSCRFSCGLAEWSKLCHEDSMNLDRIRERLRNGFKPFDIELSSGKRVKVPHPEFISVGKAVVVIIGENDSITTADALHIVSINDLPSKARKRPNP